MAGRVVAGHTPRLFRVAPRRGRPARRGRGSLRHAALGPEDMPAVGDWVALRPRHDGRAAIQAVLPRRTAFVRRAAGDRSVAQVLAANVDTVFVVMGLDADFNLRRLERTLVLAWESGAEPVVRAQQGRPRAGPRGAPGRGREASPSGVPVCVIAAKRGEGLDALAPWLQPGRTVALLGSSGVGKSTIANRLLGREQKDRRGARGRPARPAHHEPPRAVHAARRRAADRHAGAARDPALVGGRRACRRRSRTSTSSRPAAASANCAHADEPGCAVRAAVAEQRLDPARLDSFLKLQAELRSLEVREDPLKRREERAPLEGDPQVAAQGQAATERRCRWPPARGVRWERCRPPTTPCCSSPSAAPRARTT